MEPSDTVLHYADEEIDISYDAHRCIHAAECVHGLPAVFEAQAGRGSRLPQPVLTRSPM